MLANILFRLFPKLYFCVDNLNIDAGSTLTVATDVIGNIHYQRVKIAHGDDGTANDAGPSAAFPVTVLSATLGTVTISGTVTPSTTASTITNAAGNPVNVVLTSTKVTIDNTPLNVNVATATLGTVTITGTVTPSTTASTITNAVGNPVNVSLTSTAVTVAGTVSLTNTKVTVDNTVTVTPSITAVTVNIGRTLTGSSGSFTATNSTLGATPSLKNKVYGFSLTTTCPTEVVCVFHTGGLELWRTTLMAPAGASAGANLAVAPPAFLFASRTGTAVSLSISSAVLIHWSLSYFEEA